MDIDNESKVNLGVQQRKLRLTLGILILAGVVVFSVLTTKASLGIWWYVILFALLYQGIRFIYDYTTGTCAFMAEIGHRNLTALFSAFGEKIQDKAFADAIKKKSRTALVKTVIFAAIFTQSKL